MDFQHRLPLELWIMVFEMLAERPHSRSRNDIKNVRLTCRLFNTLATPFLLSSICCAPLSTSLTALTAVSRHPVLSKSVKEVVYICNRYRPDLKTLLEYKGALREEPKSKEENLAMEAEYLQYRWHCSDQTAMENSGEVIGRLCSALMRMPTVEKITVSSNFDYHYCLGSERHLRYYLEPEPAYNEAFLLIARVLSHTDVKIRELNIVPDDDFFRDPQGVSGSVFDRMSHMDMSHCCDAFRGLREVKITLDDLKGDGWMTGNCAKILSGAIDLECLRVSGSCWGFY